MERTGRELWAAKRIRVFSEICSRLAFWNEVRRGPCSPEFSARK
jgi:hypothetical protein